jgi:general secretion pathway protein K
MMSATQAAKYRREVVTMLSKAVCGRHSILRLKSESGGTGQDGFIVVAVLWILSALAILAVVYAFYVNQTAAAFIDQNDRVQAEELALAGVELVVYQLAATPRAQASHGSFGFRLGGADVAVNFRSENARIDLNAAPKELLAGLFFALGAGRENADSLADRIIVWRTPPTPGTTDTEAPLYRSAGKNYAPRRGPFQHVNELGLVLGFPSELVDRALPYLTVYSGLPGVNMVDAAPEVLAALPGMTPDILHFLMEQRDAAPLDVLRTRLGSATRYATVEASKANRVTVDVRFDAKRRNHLEIVVLPLDGDTEPFRILSWRDELDGPWSDDSSRLGLQ